MKIKDAELESWQALWSGDEGPVTPALDARRIAAQGRRRLVRRMALEIVVAIGWIVVAVTIGLSAVVIVATCGAKLWSRSLSWSRS